MKWYDPSTCPVLLLAFPLSSLTHWPSPSPPPSPSLQKVGLSVLSGNVTFTTDYIWYLLSGAPRPSNNDVPYEALLGVSVRDMVFPLPFSSYGDIPSLMPIPTKVLVLVPVGVESLCARSVSPFLRGHPYPSPNVTFINTIPYFA